MLQWLRDNLRSFAWTLWIVIAAFILLYVQEAFQDTNDAAVQRSAATIGDYEVSFSDLQRAYRTRESEYRQALGDSFSPDMMKQLGLQGQVLNQLIQATILTREADRLGFEVSKDEVRDTILGIPAFVSSNGNFVGDSQYRQILSSQGFGTPADFEQLIREDLLRGKLVAAMQESVYVPDAAVERAYRRDTERASVRYFQIPPSQFASEVEVGQEELQSHFDANREQYRRPEQRALSTLLVDIARLRSQVSVSPEDVRAYYDENPDEFTQQEQVRARHILLNANDTRSEAETQAEIESLKRRIEQGEDFATLAREVSEDPDSQNRGGELGFFGRGSKPPDFEAAAFGAQAGELVGPVRNELVTGVGFHLIEVLARREGGVRPFDTVKASIESRLRNDAAQIRSQDRATEIVTALREDSSADMESLAAEAAEVVFAETGPFGQLDLVPGFGRAVALTEAAWSLETGAVADPVKVPRGWVVARLDEIRAPAIPELAEIENEVRRAAAEEMQHSLAVERLTEARGEIEAGQAFADLAAEFGAEVTESDAFGHGGTVTGLGPDSTITESALSMTPGEIGGPVTTAQGVVLFEVTERTEFDPAEFEEAREGTRERLENEQLGRLQQAVIDRISLDDDLVRINQQLAQDIEADAQP